VKIFTRVFLTIGVIALVMSVRQTFAATRRDGATIMNSGSTNRSGYIIKLRSDGSGSVQPNRIPQNAMPRRLVIPAALAKKFLADVKAAKIASPAAPDVTSCVKSASFGYRLTVTYHGWTSADLTCPGAGAEAERLLAGIREIEQAGNIQMGPRQIHLPINEPRRIPSEGTPSPTPTESPQAPEHSGG